jgi:hypothetical protein
MRASTKILGMSMGMAERGEVGPQTRVVIVTADVCSLQGTGPWA